MSATATSESRTTPRQASGRPGLALAITGAALFMVVLDNLVVTTALPSIRDRSRRVRRAARLVRERVHADVRRAAAPGRRTRRPLRPAPDLPARTRALHARLGRRGTRAGLRRACGRPGAAGRRRSPRAAAEPDVALGGLSRRAPRGRARHLVRHLRSRDRARPARRRRRRRRHLLAVDLLAQRADRPARAAVGARCSWWRAAARASASTRSGWCSRRQGSSGSSTASCAATPTAGARRRSSGRLPAAR